MRKKNCDPFWRAALTGHGQSSQSANFWKIAKMAWNLKWLRIIPKVPLAPFKCLSKWIKVDKWDYFQNGSNDFSFLFSTLIFIYFLKYETIVRSSVCSFYYSDPYPSSVKSNWKSYRLFLFYIYISKCKEKEKSIAWFI